MKRAVIRAAFVGAYVLFGLAAGITPASAQVPPLPQPPFPPQTQPVFEMVAPTVYPECGTATLAVFEASTTADALPGTLNDEPGSIDPRLALPPGTVPHPIPFAPQIYAATAPMFAICGQVPRPPQQLTCIFDAQAQQAVSAIAAQAGAAVPLGLHPEGDAVEQTIVLEDKLPPPANLHLGPSAALVLGCAQIASPTLSEGDFSSAPSNFGSIPSYPQGPSFPGTYPGVAYPPGTQPLPPVLSGQQPRSTAAGDAVRYAAVWLLPLGFLLFGGYFGGALTRDIELGSLPG